MAVKAVSAGGANSGIKAQGDMSSPVESKQRPKTVASQPASTTGSKPSATDAQRAKQFAGGVDNLQRMDSKYQPLTFSEAAAAGLAKTGSPNAQAFDQRLGENIKAGNDASVLRSELRGGVGNNQVSPELLKKAGSAAQAVTSRMGNDNVVVRFADDIARFNDGVGAIGAKARGEAAPPQRNHVLYQSRTLAQNRLDDATNASRSFGQGVTGELIDRDQNGPQTGRGEVRNALKQLKKLGSGSGGVEGGRQAVGHFQTVRNHLEDRSISPDDFVNAAKLAKRAADASVKRPVQDNMQQSPEMLQLQSMQQLQDMYESVNAKAAFKPQYDEYRSAAARRGIKVPEY